MALPMPSSARYADVISTLYSDHHGWLCGWLRRRLSNQSDAADLAQDTFVRVLKTHTAREILEPRAFLSTIARGLLIDFFRRQTLERTYLDVLATLPASHVPSLEEQAVLRSTLHEIDQMLNGLGQKVKQAFLLSQCESLTHGEIAQRLNISVRSVDNYLARAMLHCCLLLS